ncbi:MAG: tetratricopeptide repeat protein [candidate division KSB1 bacterium]|nr:tetratricopeptide repeat protein [candidate division KSB1 bacterium]MDZ7273894.1 tetratricopeptide repeat protein [candidate division KSB1 bacterium]MDZ7286050.1 tetratricopeptide repeat protein [candidate division KSB1 bacterium]MDZ7299082.1 tetratricopeptide repeat protein [candidate division KSB1 bacterium]MDZ7306385.1 tetratricopeptide repeat protein [candidate division KSB1 bacterium]
MSTVSPFAGNPLGRVLSLLLILCAAAAAQHHNAEQQDSLTRPDSQSQDDYNAIIVPSSWADSLYLEAQIAIAKQDWIHAVITLEKLQLVRPNYLNAAEQLIQARANLNTVELSRVGQFSTGAGRMMAYLLPLLSVGIILFIAALPTSRARFELMRGNISAAARIYEKMLKRSPHRLRLYSSLADIYLMQERRDDQALQLYKTILQLNPGFKHSQRIVEILTEHYLARGQSDDEAIQWLEQTLAREKRKLLASQTGDKNQAGEAGTAADT